LNIANGTQAASTFVPYLYREFCIQVEIPIFKGEETHRLVLKTSETEDLKLCSQTPSSKYNTSSQSSIYSYLLHGHIQSNKKKSGSHHTKEFRATSQRTELQSLLLHIRRVELSHLWPQVDTVIGLELSVKTQFSFYSL
jgi:hypothetical protein